MMRSAAAVMRVPPLAAASAGQASSPPSRRTCGPVFRRCRVVYHDLAVASSSR